MIDLEEINKEIEQLENCGCTSYKVCEKLSVLYIVRNNFSGLDSISAKNNSDMMISTIPMMK